MDKTEIVRPKCHHLNLVMNVPPASQSRHERSNQKEAGNEQKIQRIYKYKALPLTASTQPSTKGFLIITPLPNLEKQRSTFKKERVLVQMNLCGFLFSAYPVLPSQLRKCLNIAKSGISTVVNPVDQRGVWGVFFFS